MAAAHVVKDPIAAAKHMVLIIVVLPGLLVIIAQGVNRATVPNQKSCPGRALESLALPLFRPHLGPRHRPSDHFRVDGPVATQERLSGSRAPAAGGGTTYKMRSQ